MPNEPGLDPYLYCEELTRRRESNFSLGFAFLPPDKRRAIHVVYAFCRYVDDIADACGELAESDSPAGDIEALLGAWRKEIADIYEHGRSGHPIGQALLDVLKRYPVPADGFLELIQGCEQDQQKKTYRTFEELSGYCELVATSIAKVSLPVYGFDRLTTGGFDPSTESTLSNVEGLRASDALGPGRDLSFAFQLTNILRDVAEDLGRGRCYLPQEDLDRFGLTPERLSKGASPEAIRALYAFEGERCEAYFKKGGQVLEYLRPDSRRCVSVMKGAYHTLLRKILKDPLRAMLSQTVLNEEDKAAVTGAP